LLRLLDHRLRGKVEPLESSLSSQESARKTTKQKGSSASTFSEAHTPFTVLVDRKLEKVPDAKQERARRHSLVEWVIQQSTGTHTAERLLTPKIKMEPTMEQMKWGNGGINPCHWRGLVAFSPYHIVNLYPFQPYYQKKRFFLTGIMMPEQKL
jgi:hypothetical protein